MRERERETERERERERETERQRKEIQPHEFLTRELRRIFNVYE